MNGHVTNLLPAYYDGQLNGKRLRQVEEHLQTCLTCQAELQELNALSALLHAPPVADDLLPPDVFVAQVGMRLPRKQQRPEMQRRLLAGWQAIPFGLLGIWAFVQAVFVVSSVIMLTLNVVPGGDQIVAMLPSPEAAPAQGDSSLLLLGRLGFGFFGDPGAIKLGRFGMQIFGDISPIGWSILLNVVITGLIGLMYWSWLASWWIRNTNGNFQKS